MKKHNVESPQESLPRLSEIRLTTLTPKGTKSDYDGSYYILCNNDIKILPAFLFSKYQFDRVVANYPFLKRYNMSN